MFPPGDGGDAVQQQQTRRGRMGEGARPNMMGRPNRGPMPGMGAPQGLGGGVPPMPQRMMRQQGPPPPQMMQQQGPAFAPRMPMPPQPAPQWNMPESTLSQGPPVADAGPDMAARRNMMMQRQGQIQGRMPTY